MTKFLSGREASVSIVQSISEQFYAYDNSSSQQLVHSNIWNRPVKVFQRDPFNDPLSHVAESFANRNVTNAFMSSQSLMASIPYLHKLATDNSSVVLHVTAGNEDSFADFTDVMSVRGSGFALLSSSTVQEAQDLALVAQHVSLLTSTPFLHFFDSKRISDERCSVQILDKETLLQFLPEDLISSKIKNKTSVSTLFQQSTYRRYKEGQSQKIKEVDDTYHLDVFTTFNEAISKFAKITGRSYPPLEYVGHPEATCVIVSMGAGATVVEQTVKALADSQPDFTVGCLKIRLFRPWSDQTFLNALPSSVRHIAVLEPTNDYAHSWNPLFLDVAAAYQTTEIYHVDIFSGQYGIQVTDFSPDMVRATLNALQFGTLDRHFEPAKLLDKPNPLQVMAPSTEQIIFVGNSSLAFSFAAHQTGKKYVQTYAVDSVPITHIRVAGSFDPLLPSLIQEADAIVLPDLLPDDQSNLLTSEAVSSLCHGGYILSGVDIDSLPSYVKKEAYNKQAKLVYIQNIHHVLTNVSLSEAINYSSSSISSCPQSWAQQLVYMPSTSSMTTKPKKVTESTFPVETPYIKMLDQSFGPRLNIANAYHSSSIWSPNKSHSNAASQEFGYGRLIHQMQEHTRFVDYVVDVIRNSSLPTEALRALSQWILLINSPTPKPSIIRESAELVTNALTSIMDQSCVAQKIMESKDLFLPKSHWLIGSDSWAYDFGQSGIHHAIACGQNINILIVDTTPCHNQKQAEQRKKDIGLYAMNYGSVYVASVALYASYTGVLQALMEADAYQGPSIVLAYLPQLSTLPDPLSTLKETKISVDNGTWPLYRWNPALEDVEGQDMFSLDSQRIKKDLEAFLSRENYLTQLVSGHPDLSNALVSSLESDVKKRHDQLKSKARADYARLLSGFASSSNGSNLTVLFGSDNGNAKEIAKMIATRAKSKGLSVKLMAMDDYEDIQSLAKETNLVLICSTSGQGEMPFNAREFWKSLNSLTVNDINLSEVNVAVFGLGDSHYWPREEDAIFYNRPGKLLDAKFEYLGANKLVALGLADDQDENGFEAAISIWLPELWKALGANNVVAANVEPEYIDTQMKIDSNYLRGDIAQEIADDSTGGVTETTQKLMKFHGAYIQDDRDLREERKVQGMEKAFSFLIRVCTPGGVSTPKQWLVMDMLSEKYGNKTLKLTTRQTYQLHGVLKRNLRTTIRAINKALLTTLAACGDVNRNIMSSAYTEIPEVHDQVQSLVHDLKDLLAPKTNAYYEIWLDNSMVAGHAVQDFEPIYGPSYLPRKFKVAIAVPPSNDVDVYAHDLGFIAIINTDSNCVDGYNVLIGGGMGQTHGNKKTYPRPATLIGYIPAIAAVNIAKAVVLIQRDYGDRVNRRHARFKYTVDDLGVDFVKNQIEERSGVKFEEAKPFSFDDNVDRYGWTRGTGDCWNFGMFIENGRVRDTPDFLCKTGLRELARFHKGGFRLTANQHLVICNVPQLDLEKTKAHLAKYKLDNLSFTGIRKASIACVALPTCGLAMAESERYLPQLISLLEETVEESGLREDSIVIRMTGCPNGCARPYLAEIAFVGKAPNTYNMYLGGSRKGERLNKLYLENLLEEDILKEVKPMIKRYALERNNGESFGDWVIRAGYVKRTITGLDFHDLS